MTSSTHDHYDIAIIGAGAAGLMAAIFAARQAPQDTRIIALDSAKKLGAKILVSGGGRCNVTHYRVTADDFAGANRNQVKKVLKSFSVRDTAEFFLELGVTLKREETGKLFPTSDDARTVLDALLKAAWDAKVELAKDHRVEAIERCGEGFVITTSQRPIHARRVILATGGKSLPKTGSDGHGYALAQHLGHSVTDTTPALVPLVLAEGHWLTEHAGVAVDVELSLVSATNKVLHRQAGAMLATHFGVSGPAPMDISRHWIAAHQQSPGVKLMANLLPSHTFDQLEAELVDLAQRMPRTKLLTVLADYLPEKLARSLLAHEAAAPPDTPMAQLKREDRRRLVHAITALPLPVVRDRGYLFAEVTAGGVPLEEVDLATMASRRCDGLHLCGEILNCDGRIGGFNFQWAWCTGRLAGLAAADAIRS